MTKAKNELADQLDEQLAALIRDDAQADLPASAQADLPASAQADLPASAQADLKVGTTGVGHSQCGAVPDAHILEAARAHGVQALLGDQIQRGRIGSSWPTALRASFLADARALALAEPLRCVELKRTLESFDEVGVPSLVLKGAHLAYSYYPHPGLRPFSDVDLLIRHRDRQTVAELMHDMGYVPGRYAVGELVSFQHHYERWDAHALRHEYDIHWKISNPQLFAGMLPFEELLADAVSIGPLGAAARGLSPAHALLLACIHRAAHHNASRRLIWLYDMHLIARSMGPVQFERFLALAAEKRIRAVCASALDLVQRRFGTCFPAFVLETLKTPRTDEAEPSAAFLNDGRRKIDELISDLRCLNSWTARLQLIREHLFPPPAWVTGPSTSVSSPRLMFLYVHRALLGAARWFRRSSG